MLLWQVVTTRRTSLKRVTPTRGYTTVELTGFSKEDMENYVTQFFPRNALDGERNCWSIPRRSMPLPLWLAIHSSAWRFATWRKGQIFIGTRTLTKVSLRVLIMYLVHHARAKQKTFSKDQVNSMIRAVGEVALKSLVHDETNFQ